jgi:cobalamin biosynthesis protein CobC
MLEHGGQRAAAAARYGIPLSDWVDLSTGINPLGWPVPPLPAEAWSRLPEDDDGLEKAAAAYYGAAALLAVAGSQAAIQALPTLRAASRVRLMAPAYAEHAHAWRIAGHRVSTLDAAGIDNALSDTDVLVLVNPNNPTGLRFPRERLLDWHARLSENGGWLVVDEAFMDATPDDSLVPACPRPGLFVLRSLGKFFGLAGARVGFVFADYVSRAALADRLGPWAVSGPGRWVAREALADTDWQAAMRASLGPAGARLRDLLDRHGLPPDGGCTLFQWVKTPAAEAIHERLARQGILVRLFGTPASLRFGLPGSEADWVRLADALARRSPARVSPVSGFFAPRDGGCGQGSGSG